MKGLKLTHVFALCTHELLDNLHTHSSFFEGFQEDFTSLFPFYVCLNSLEFLRFIWVIGYIYEDLL